MIDQSIINQARSVLLDPFTQKWTVQGFGMLRCYLDADHVYRLNIWDGRLRYPGVSMIHDHPWHFESYVLVGSLKNLRYRHSGDGQPYDAMKIITGEGGAQIEELKPVLLTRGIAEWYDAGKTYHQRADEIHETDAVIGTVTLNKRERVHGDVATVFWPKGKQWVTAEPRAATPDEIKRAVRMTYVHILTELEHAA
jgi:hypothetical protein